MLEDLSLAIGEQVETGARDQRAARLLRELFDYFVARPDEMGDEARGPRDGQCSVQRAVCDFLAGMTDRFAIRTHERLFVPRAWE